MTDPRCLVEVSCPLGDHAAVFDCESRQLACKECGLIVGAEAAAAIYRVASDSRTLGLLLGEVVGPEEVAAEWLPLPDKVPEPVRRWLVSENFISATNVELELLQLEVAMERIARSVAALWDAIHEGVYDSRSVCGDRVLDIKEALEECGFSLDKWSKYPGKTG